MSDSVLFDLFHYQSGDHMGGVRSRDLPRKGDYLLHALDYLEVVAVVHPITPLFPAQDRPRAARVVVMPLRGVKNIPNV